MTTTRKTAVATYNEAHASVVSKLAEMQRLVQEHMLRQAGSPSNWEWAGDMQSMESQLESMLEVMRRAG